MEPKKATRFYLARKTWLYGRAGCGSAVAYLNDGYSTRKEAEQAALLTAMKLGWYGELRIAVASGSWTFSTAVSDFYFKDWRLA